MLAIAVVTASCASTSQELDTPALLEGGTATTSPASAPGATPEDTGAGQTAVSQPGTGSGAPGAGAASGAGSPTGPTDAGNDAGGVAGELPIGIVIPVRSGSAAQLGMQGIADAGRDPFEAVIAHLNANGGIAGRAVVPVYDEYDTTTSTFATEAQAACATFTEDHQVAAVVGWGYDRDVLISCLAAKGTPVVKDSFILYDHELYDRYRGYLYAPSQLSGDRLGVWVDQLAAAGFFEPDSRVGLVRFDTPEHARASADVIRPRLAAAGHELDEEVAIANFNSAGSLADVSVATQSAVLRFKAAGVDRVLILDTGSPITLFFTTHAESQNYRPRYGLNSFNYVDSAIQNAPKAQFETALGVGWLPASDAFDASKAAAQQCLQIMSDAGVPAPTGGDALGGQLGACTSLFFLRDALAGAATVDAESLRLGVDGLGDRFASPSTVAARFFPGRSDGAGAVRLFAWDPSRQRFLYTSPPIAAP